MKKSTDHRPPERLRTEFTREGGYYLLVVAFVLTGAMLRDINLMMLIAGIMAGLWVYNWRRSAAMLRKIAFRRNCPRTISAGDLLVVDIEVANLSRRQTKRGLVVRDTVRHLIGRKTIEESSGQVIFESVPAGNPIAQSYQGRIWSRGRYELGPLDVSCRFPFGLMRRRGRVDDRQAVTVFPRVGQLTPAWSRLHDDALVGSQRLRRRQTQVEGDFYGLRDWREGDSHRWIHWRTSARRGKLVVRQYERQRRQDVILLVELWQPAKPTEAQADAVELAVSFAATVVVDLCRRGGSQVHLVVGGRERAALVGVASQGLLAEMLSSLALAQASEDDLLGQIVLEGLQMAPRSARLVIISTRQVDVAKLADSTAIPKDVSSVLTKMRSICIDCGSRELDEYFAIS